MAEKPHKKCFFSVMTRFSFSISLVKTFKNVVNSYIFLGVYIPLEDNVMMRKMCRLRAVKYLEEHFNINYKK